MRGSAALGYLFRYVFGNQSYYDLLKRKLFEQIDVSLQANRCFTTSKSSFHYKQIVVSRQEKRFTPTPHSKRWKRPVAKALRAV
jgi:hypothetical protein